MFAAGPGRRRRRDLSCKAGEFPFLPSQGGILAFHMPARFALGDQRGCFLTGESLPHPDFGPELSQVEVAVQFAPQPSS